MLWIVLFEELKELHLKCRLELNRYNIYKTWMSKTRTNIISIDTNTCTYIQVSITIATVVALQFIINSVDVLLLLLSTSYSAYCCLSSAIPCSCILLSLFYKWCNITIIIIIKQQKHQNLDIQTLPTHRSNSKI